MDEYVKENCWLVPMTLVIAYHVPRYLWIDEGKEAEALEQYGLKYIPTNNKEYLAVYSKKNVLYELELIPEL